MKNFETGAMPPPQEKPRFVVGAKKGLDGSRDYSQAMDLTDDDGQLAQGFEKLEKREMEARAKKLEIPKDIKPGSADMAWYTMRNTILINEEAAEKSRKEGKPDKHKEALIQAQNMQQAMFNNAATEFTTQQAGVKTPNLTAIEMHDIIQKHLVDRYQKLQNEGEENAYLQQGHFGGNYPIKDLLKAASDLQSRLIDEASRAEKH